MDNIKIFKLQTVKTNKPGELHFSDIETFMAKRVFLINNFKDLNGMNTKRGLHSNYNFDELIIVNEGNVNINIIDSKENCKSFNLVKNDCMYFPRGLWLELIFENPNTSLTVLANETKELSRSEYNFNIFKNQK